MEALDEIWDPRSDLELTLEPLIMKGLSTYPLLPGLDDLAIGHCLKIVGNFQFLAADACCCFLKFDWLGIIDCDGPENVPREPKSEIEKSCVRILMA